MKKNKKTSFIKCTGGIDVAPGINNGPTDKIPANKIEFKTITINGETFTEDDSGYDICLSYNNPEVTAHAFADFQFTAPDGHGVYLYKGCAYSDAFHSGKLSLWAMHEKARDEIYAEDVIDAIKKEQK